jgi:hypothetical protein
LHWVAHAVAVFEKRTKISFNFVQVLSALKKSGLITADGDSGVEQTIDYISINPAFIPAVVAVTRLTLEFAAAIFDTLIASVFTRVVSVSVKDITASLCGLPYALSILEKLAADPEVALKCDLKMYISVVASLAALQGFVFQTHEALSQVSVLLHPTLLADPKFKELMETEFFSVHADVCTMLPLRQWQSRIQFLVVFLMELALEKNGDRLDAAYVNLLATLVENCKGDQTAEAKNALWYYASMYPRKKGDTFFFIMVI